MSNRIEFASQEAKDARKAFVAMLREENRQGASNQLKAHWRGANYGFAYMHIDQRWRDYLAGYAAAKEER